LVKEIGLSLGNQLVFQRLQDQGVIYLKGMRQGDKTEKLFAVYDDVVLAEINNTPKGITDFASQWRILGNEILLKSKLVEDALYIRIFRVQGGKIKPNISKITFKITFKINGKRIEIEGEYMLHLTFDDTKRVAHFWEKRGSESVVFTAEVKKSFYDKIKREAVKQNKAKRYPNRPQIDDPTKTNNSFGIPKEYFNELLKSMKNPEIIKIK